MGHVDLTASSTVSLTALGAPRTFTVQGGDSTTKLNFFSADSTGQSAGAPLVDASDNKRNQLVLRANQSRTFVDSSSYVAYALTGTAPTAVWVDGPAGGTAIAATVGAFGDGGDGTVTFDGTTVVLGITPSASAYTLTRDIFLANGTLNAGVTINTAGFKIFCAGLWVDAATSVIANNGGAGGVGAANTAGAAGAAGAAGSTGGGVAGGAGGAGSNAGSAGAATIIAFPGLAGTGGAGGTDGTNGGGAAGACTPLAASKGGARAFPMVALAGVFGSGGFALYGGGSGGGGGGGNNADAGGGGGGGSGGVAFLAANNLVHNGAMTATGGAGGNGFSTSHGAGGGGGGQGGVVLAIYRTLSGPGTFVAAGGAGGAKAGTVTPVAGTAGASGIVESIAI